jgi:hypothetical protein
MSTCKTLTSLTRITLAVHAALTTPVQLPPTNLSSDLIKLPKRNRRRHGLAAGYRLMAWRSLREGDRVNAAMHAACSNAVRATAARCKN